MDETVTSPTWGYRRNAETGEVESKLFELEAGGKLPDGWADSPAGLPEAAGKKKKPVPVKADDDSA